MLEYRLDTDRSFQRLIATDLRRAFKTPGESGYRTSSTRYSRQRPPFQGRQHTHQKGLRRLVQKQSRKHPVDVCDKQ